MLIKEDLIKIAVNFTLTNRGNRLPGRDQLIFTAPVFGFASSDDPLFMKLQELSVVGPHHKLPADWLSTAKTVIVYALPINGTIIDSNIEGVKASEEWIFTRFHGEAFNNQLRQVIVSVFQESGYQASAPLLSSEYAVTDLKGNWSERHAAYIAGLGTFGLNRGIITKNGLAGRIGSVISNVDWEPTNRTYTELYQHCSWFADRSCGVCIQRCPSGAIRESGKDTATCEHHLKVTEGNSVKREYGFTLSPCGKCFSAVPCEKGLPSSLQ